MLPKPESICSIFFENKEVEFINIASILWDPDILKSLPISTIKCLMPTVTYELPPFLSTISFSILSFSSLYNLDLDLFSINSDSSSYKYNNSSFADRHHNHIVNGDLRIIKKK